MQLDALGRLEKELESGGAADKDRQNFQSCGRSVALALIGAREVGQIASKTKLQKGPMATAL